MRKFARITFRNAAICYKNKRDFVYDLSCFKSAEVIMPRLEHPIAKTAYKEFKENSDFDYMFGLNHVSNMLHVMCGCRPVPFLRETLLHRIPEIDNVARNTWVKIENLYMSQDKKSKKCALGQITQGKKAVQNANVKKCSVIASDGTVFKAYMTWNKFKQRYFFENREKYDTLMNQFKLWYGSDTFVDDYSLVDFLLFLSEKKCLKKEMKEFFEKLGGVTFFINVIERNNEKVSSFNNAADNKKNDNFNLGRLSINTVPIYKVYLNGTFIIPIDNVNIYNEMRYGTRSATFLEGGCAFLEEITSYVDTDELEDDGFKQIFL